MRLLLMTGALLFAIAPRPAAAEQDEPKSQGTEEMRLERKCAQQREKDRRDEDRGRKHAQRDNKWDELCAPPPPPVVDPPAVQPPVIVPPVIVPPVIVPPMPLPPPA